METLQELLVASLDFEMISVEENASAEDDDLMRIKCPYDFLSFVCGQACSYCKRQV